MKGEFTMKSEREIREMIYKVDDYRQNLSWRDEGEEACLSIIDALLWVLGDKSGKSIDPDDWSEDDEENV